MARSNVSNSLKELQNCYLIQVVHLMGDRRDHFTTSTDVWQLFKIVVQQRKSREFDPTLTVLRDCLANPELDSEDAATQERIKAALGFMETLSDWGEQMLKLEPSTLMKVMHLGSKIKDLLSLK